MPLPAVAVPHRCAVALTAVPATATIPPPFGTVASLNSRLAP
jgi:hypothetical protein